jgi:hypothetical protein
MERLIYALIGAVFGTVLGLVCWWLYGLAFSVQRLGTGLNHDAIPWIKVFVGLFAVLGFVLKDRAGSVVGQAIAGIFSIESQEDHGPNLSFGKGLFVLVVVAAIVWYVVSQ